MDDVTTTPPDLPFRQALDHLDSGIGFYRPDLSLVFANRKLRRLLGDDSGLALGVERVLGEIAGECGQSTSDGEVRTVADQDVEGISGAFRVRGGCVAMDLWSTGRSLVITVDHGRRGGQPSPEEVARRFRLTQRETELAFLLANGRSNDEIAGTLFLSPHTVRNYTRRVLRKLGASSRAQVGAKLQGPP